MTLSQLQLIFRAHIRVIMLTLCMVVAGALMMAAVLPTVYKASATLLVDVRSPDTMLGNSGLPFTSPAYMNTQSELVASGRVVERAISILKLEESETLQEMWNASGSKKPAFKQWLVEFIQRSLTVAPGKESNTLTLTVSSDSPEFAANLANGLAQAYISTSVAMNVEPAKAFVRFFEEQKAEAREKLIEAQARLSDFQRERGIVIATDDQIDVENARLNELSTALTQVQTQRADQVGRASSSGAQGLLQDPMSNVVLNSLRTQLQQKQAALAEASVRIGVNHPEYQRLSAEVDSLQSNVNTEIARSNATLRATASAAISQESSIRRALEDQRNRILKLTADRDSAMTLQRDLDAAKKQFELVSARTSMSEISSRHTTSNTFLVSAAGLPSKPSSPGLKLIGFSAILFGLLLGLVMACAIEFLDHRIRSTDDLTSLGIPVLSKISSSNQHSQLKLLPR